MAPTIAIKNRARVSQEEQSMAAAAASSLFRPHQEEQTLGETNFPRSARSVSIGSEWDSESCDSQDDTAALMLLSIAKIVSKEYNNDTTCLMDDGTEDPENQSCAQNDLDDKDSDDECSESSHHPRTPSPPASEDRFQWTRVRTVSIDSPILQEKFLTKSPKATIKPVLVSPEPSPATRGRPLRKASLRMCQKAKREQQQKQQKQKAKTESTQQHKAAKMAQSNKNAVHEHHQKAIQASKANGKTIHKILRKKFSWKNYPELEAFLIANREEYLRHSALNYTVQQKQYNNRLTEQLLELAAEHGYVFDETEFSFVTVRDRIRCYFKSYVQSAKKRGILMGYAARKAGLLNEDDLKEEAEGRIVVPDNLEP